MRKNVPAVCFFLSTAFASAAPAAWELAPPDAKILIGVDVRGLRNSSLTDSMTAQTRAQMQAAAAMFHMPGAELLDDIDSLFLASTGDFATTPKTVAPVTALKPGAAAKPNATFLVIVSGTFPDAHLRPLLKGPHPSYKGINVYRGTGANSGSLAVLDEHTVLIGDDKSLYRAIDRKTTGVKAQGPMITRARELAASNDIWLVARDPSGALQKAASPGAAFASEIEGLDVGVSMREGFNLDFALATKTEAGAEALAQLLATQMQTAVNAKLDGQKAQEFWRKVKMGAVGKSLQLQIAMTKEELQENIRLAQEQRTEKAPQSSGTSTVAGWNATVTAPKPVVNVKPAEPPKPRTIKIYGLDDGVREIKLDQ